MKNYSFLKQIWFFQELPSFPGFVEFYVSFPLRFSTRFSIVPVSGMLDFNKRCLLITEFLLSENITPCKYHILVNGKTTPGFDVLDINSIKECFDLIAPVSYPKLYSLCIALANRKKYTCKIDRVVYEIFENDVNYLS